MHTNRIILSFGMVAMAAIMAVCTPSVSSAQGYTAPPVEISKEKVSLNGKIYYSHIVREKQTLFSISKAYQVSVDAITAANPKIKDTGLKKNDIILIPVASAPAAQTARPVQEPVQTAEPAPAPAMKETKQMEEENTEAADKVKTPRKDKKKQTIHKRKWYEDLDVIAEKYNVTVEALMQANGLTGRKLSKGQKLIIPDGNYVPDTPASPATAPEATVQTLPDSSSTAEIPMESPADEVITDWAYAPKTDISMTLILPLKSKGDNPSRNNIDFYSGVLAAVRNIGEAGIKTELNVFDSSDPATLIEAETLSGSDVIMGPVAIGELRRMIPEVPENIGIVSPLDPRAETLAYQREDFIQAPTPHFVQSKDLADWIMEDRQASDKVIMIHEKGESGSDASMQMKAAADSAHLGYIPFSYSILEGRDVTEPLAGLMTAEGVNRVIIASESEAFVNDVVRNLNILIHRKLNIVLYAASKIRSFETIEVENLHNTSLHMSLGYYIDYDDKRVQRFLMEYRALFNTEPTQYAFQGYDLATYFISLCGKYGNRWEKKLDTEDRSMLQSTFDFEKTECGGFINKGVRRVVYGKDWSVTKIR